MRIRFLTLFLVVSCFQAISSSDLLFNFTSAQRGLNPSKSNIQTQDASERCGRIKDAIGGRRKVEESKMEGKYELSDDIRKAHRGQGAQGGGNVDSRPYRSKNSTASLLSWISTLILHVSLASTFLFSFHLF